MGHTTGRVSEIRMAPGRHIEALIACSVELIPQPGQYLLASDLDDPLEVLGVPLFLSELTREGFWSALPTPSTWLPGTRLDLMGPLGHGFSLPNAIQRLALAALGETTSRLMPLVRQFTASHTAITLYCNLPLPPVPASVEAYPLGSLPEALDWSDFMVFDLPLELLSELRKVIGLHDGRGLPCPAQVLVTAPMPCVGLAHCGACALPAGRGWKLACEDGPVFDLGTLSW